MDSHAACQHNHYDANDYKWEVTNMSFEIKFSIVTTWISKFLPLLQDFKEYL